MDLRRALALTLGVLVVAAVALTLASPVGAVVVAVVTTAALLGVARAAGLGADDLGLGRRYLATGLRWAAVALVGAAVVAAVALAVPTVREALPGADTPRTVGGLVFRLLVFVPLQTVLLEEVAFRGVLWALLRRLWGLRTATWGSSVLFGLWHLKAAPGFLASHDQTSGWGYVAAFVGIIAFTTVAGLVFSELRRRSGSLLAPAGLHYAVNGVGTLAAYLAT